MRGEATALYRECKLKLNYDSEKLGLLEKSSQVTSPPRSRLSSRSSSQKPHMVDLSTRVEDRQEEDKGRILELQRRNSKALPHLKSSYALELQTHGDIGAFQTWQNEEIREENTESYRKITKLCEEIDHLRAREKEMTALCREYKMMAESEQDRALSTSEEIKKLQSKLDSYEIEKAKEIKQLQQELEQVQYRLSKEQRQAASEKSSLTAQLNYASEKLRMLEKSSQVTTPPPSLWSSRQKPAPIHKVDLSASTISSSSTTVHDTHSDVELIQHEFNHEESRSVIPTEFPSTEENNELAFSGDTTKKRATLASSQPYRGRSGASSPLSTLMEDRQEDDECRILELQKRNSKTLPHLRSSYAIELQTHRKSPSIFDEHIKNGSRRFRKVQKTPQTMALHFSAKKPVSFEIGLQPGPLLSSTVVTKGRKRSRDDVAQNDDNMISPAPKSLRRGRAPPTPQTPVDILETRLSTMAAGGLKLREYLDTPVDIHSGDSAGQSNSGIVVR